MATLTMPGEVANGLPLKERLLLFGAATGTDWHRAGVTGENVIAMIVKGMISRHGGGTLALTDRGRAVLRAMFPEH